MRAKRNKYVRRSKFSPIPGLFFATALTLIGVTGCLFFWALDTKCNVLGEDIRCKEMQQRALNEQLIREEIQWNASKTPEKLDEALTAHGLQMRYPKADQLVRMTPGGTPVRGQLSMVKFERTPHAAGRFAKK